MPRSVLIVDDEELIRRSLSRTFESAGYTTSCASSGVEALRLLAADAPTCAIIDLRLGDMDGFEILRLLRSQHPRTKAIVITAHGDLDNAVQALRLGAFDFIRKPFDIEEVLTSANNAIRADALEAHVAYLNARVAPSPQDMVYASPAMRSALELLHKIAVQPVPMVLLQGESGTGKEVAAKILHQHSARAAGPFIELNCSALPEQLVESELFGHERGAFSDAKEQKRGLVELADGGTLFLDEIGDLPAAAQAKLLKFVETHEARRVGGTQTMRIDCRIVAATHKDLEHDPTFRRDLYFRLGGIKVTLPPLRDRGDDVMLLARHFLAGYALQYHKPLDRFAPEAQAALCSYHWPGNIRELKAVLSYAAIRAEGPEITVALLGNLEGTTMPKLVAPRSMDEVVPLDAWVQAYCHTAVALCAGNKQLAAQKLNISRHTLARRLDAREGSSSEEVRDTAGAEAEGKGGKVRAPA